MPTPKRTAPTREHAFASAPGVEQIKVGAGALKLVTDKPVMKKQGFVLPLDLLDRARHAQILSQVYGGEETYASLNDFVQAAIEHQLQRCATMFNDGQPIQPFTGHYRRGPKPRS